MLAEHGLGVTTVVLLLARLRAGARAARRGGAGAVRRLPRRPRRARDAHDPDLHRRPHVRPELGSGVARGPRPLPRRLARLAAGVVRRRDRPPLRPPPRRRRLARLERDAAVRRPRRRATRSPRGRGIVVQAVRAAGATQPISLGDGAWGVEVSGDRQRLLAPRARAARRLHRAALLPDAGRRAAAGADAGLHLRARGQLRQARRARGVRRQLRLRLRGERGRLLPPGAAHDAARRCARLARLEQLRLRRHPRRGPVPPPRLRAPFRAHRPQRAGRRSSCA